MFSVLMCLYWGRKTMTIGDGTEFHFFSARKSSNFVKQLSSDVFGAQAAKNAATASALHPSTSVIVIITSHGQLLSSFIIQQIRSTLGLAFNMVAEPHLGSELLIADFLTTTTSGMTTTSAEAADNATAIIIIIINITASIRYHLSTASRCSTPSQHIHNKLPSICCIFDNNDCFNESTSAGSPSSTTSSVATDNCGIVDNIAFYIDMLGQPNTRLPIPTFFDGNNPPFLEWTSEVRGFLQLNDFAFMTSLDTIFNEVHPVTQRRLWWQRRH